MSEKAGTGVKFGWGSESMGALQDRASLNANEEKEISFNKTMQGGQAIGAWKLLCIAPNIPSGKIKVKNVTIERV